MSKLKERNLALTSKVTAVEKQKEEEAAKGERLQQLVAVVKQQLASAEVGAVVFFFWGDSFVFADVTF